MRSERRKVSKQPTTSTRTSDPYQRKVFRLRALMNSRSKKPRTFLLSYSLRQKRSLCKQNSLAATKRLHEAGNVMSFLPVCFGRKSFFFKDFSPEIFCFLACCGFIMKLAPSRRAAGEKGANNERHSFAFGRAPREMFSFLPA